MQNMASVYKVAWLATHRHWCDHKRAQRARHAKRHVHLLQLAVAGQEHRASVGPDEPREGPWQPKAPAELVTSGALLPESTHNAGPFAQPGAAVQLATSASQHEQMTAQRTTGGPAAIALSPESRARQAELTSAAQQDAQPTNAG